MISILLKNRPVVKDKCSGFISASIILSVFSIVLLMLPVIVNVMNKFSAVDGGSDIIYYILRGLFGLSLAVGAAVFAVKKDILSATIPCLLGFITALFPLYDSVAALTKAHSVAQQLSMAVGYGPYLVTIGEYLLFALLCLFTLLYSIGAFRYTLIIQLISVVASLATIFTTIDKFITYDISTYEILSFAYAAFACLIPLVLVLCTNTSEKAPTKYKARRMR
ncbi:MAG: hypothetical protein IJ298_07845 [Ruminococcus sp.]|nr:hypothetical protein [Ruminococcus sp.]